MTKVQALAFDYQQIRILFVDKARPDSIWGVRHFSGTHLILQEKSASFDSIVVDPVTHNLYFADRSKLFEKC